MQIRLVSFVVVAQLMSQAGAHADEPADRASSGLVAGEVTVESDETVRSDDPNISRLLLGPTARSLKRGESYLDLVGMIVPLVQVGVTDRLSIGAGAPLLIPGIRPDEAVVVTPKIQLFETGRTAAAVGLVHLVVDRRRHNGLAYAVATRGTRDTAVTLGMGYLYEGWGQQGGAPVLVVGGEKRVSDRVKVIAENYVGLRTALVSAGVRLIRTRTSWDFGLGRYVGSGSEMPPYGIVRFSWRFSAPA
jgi:hypothetical protein